ADQAGQRVVRGPGLLLQVLRVDVAAPEDHHFLDTSGDEDLAVALRGHVAGAQPARAFALALDPRGEGLGALGGTAPVAGADALAAQPQLADPALRHAAAGGRVHDA